MKLESILSLAFVGLMLTSISSETACAIGAQTQREAPIGDLTGRDAVGFRKDKVTKESVGERSVIRAPDAKQTMQDFKQIQELNYKLRRASKNEPIPVEEIVDTASKMNIIAVRLKSNLILPKTKEKTDIAPADSLDALMSQISETDTSVRAFVTNPLFRQGTDTTKDLPMEASTNLAKVIALTKAVREGASKVAR